MKKAVIATLVSLSVSAPAYAQSEIDNLLAASQELSQTITSARYAVSGSAHYASVGGIPEVGTLTQFTISQEQMDTYNNALQGVRDAVYYNSKMLFEDKHEEAMTNLSSAVDVFTVAAQEIAKVDAVAEVASTADTTEEQIAVQDFIATSDVELTQQEVSAYNDSLADIETHAQEAAAFLQAANDTFITDTADQHAQDFNTSSYNATVTYTATNDTLRLAWGAYEQISYHGFFSADFKNSAEVLGMGQSIYADNTMEQ